MKAAVIAVLSSRDEPRKAFLCCALLLLGVGGAMDGVSASGERDIRQRPHCIMHFWAIQCAVPLQLSRSRFQEGLRRDSLRWAAQKSPKGFNALLLSLWLTHHGRLLILALVEFRSHPSTCIAICNRDSRHRLVQRQRFTQSAISCLHWRSWAPA